MDKPMTWADDAYRAESIRRFRQTYDELARLYEDAKARIEGEIAAGRLSGPPEAVVDPQGRPILLDTLTALAKAGVKVSE